MGKPEMISRFLNRNSRLGDEGVWHAADVDACAGAPKQGLLVLGFCVELLC